MKKLLCSMLSLIMCLSLALPAAAKTESVIPEQLPAGAVNRMGDYAEISAKFYQANTTESILKRHRNYRCIELFDISGAHPQKEDQYVTREDAYHFAYGEHVYGDNSGLYYSVSDETPHYTFDTDHFMDKVRTNPADGGPRAMEAYLSVFTPVMYYELDGRIYLYDQGVVDYGPEGQELKNVTVVICEVIDASTYELINHMEYYLKNGEAILSLAEAFSYDVAAPEEYTILKNEFNRKAKHMITATCVMDPGLPTQTTLTKRVPANSAVTYAMIDGYSAYYDDKGTDLRPEYSWDGLSDLTIYMIKDK